MLPPPPEPPVYDNAYRNESSSDSEKCIYDRWFDSDIAELYR